jgi:hypothetical protein
MVEPKDCPQCGVPEYISHEHEWLDKGDIVHSRDRKRRVVFIESGNIDPLLAGIEELVGVSIEKIVIGCVRKNVRAPLSLFVPDDARERIKRGEEDYEPILETFSLISHSMGRGKLELVSKRYERDEHDFCKFRMTEPFSIPLCCGARAAGIEAILGYPHGVTYEMVSPQVYDITVFPTREYAQFEGRLLPEDYRHDPGGVEFERCPSCGAPTALAAYLWHRERGVIENATTGHRMVLISPYELDPVFGELESELGETIPEVVVEAQRRFTRTGFYSFGDITDPANLRAQLALRGLGELVDCVMDAGGLRLRLENNVLHLMVVGMVQGLFETVYGRDSVARWEFTPPGLLEMELQAGG